MRIFPALFLIALGSAAQAAPLPADPLRSPMWDYHGARIFGGAPVVFDDRVIVQMPEIAENQRVFPVLIDARALPDVKRIVLLADLNPIPVAIDYRPHHAAAFVATRIKLDQRTPVRAAVLLGDGSWHVSGGWIDAAGGGCSAPPVSRVKGDWADHLGELRAAALTEAAGVRVRMNFRHPMDTGLVENIAAYNIDSVRVADGDKVLADLTVYGAVSEDPAFTLLVDAPTGAALRIAARDTNGRDFTGTVTPRPVQTALAQ